MTKQVHEPPKLCPAVGTPESLQRQKECKEVESPWQGEDGLQGRFEERKQQFATANSGNQGTAGNG